MLVRVMKKIGKIAGTISGLALLASMAFGESGKIYLPVKGEVSLDAPITPNGHFTWKEAVVDGVPSSYKQVENIVETAQVMEGVRRYFGNKPIKVNSWYRSEESNSKLANAASRSQHLDGKAVDFVVIGVPSSEVYKRLDQDLNWQGGLGKYTGRTHIDTRNYKARWTN